MQRFRLAVVAAAGLTATASVMAGVTAAPGHRSGVAIRTTRVPSTTATRSIVALAAVAAGPGPVATRHAKNSSTPPKSAAWWRTQIAVVNCASHRQVAPERLSLACARGTYPPGNYVNGLRWRRWNRQGGSARGVGDEHPATCAGLARVTVLLWRPRPWHGHAGMLYFTRMTVINHWIPTAWSPKTQTIHLWS
jgi:hypothetical protein